MLPASGSATARANPTATAASTAFPPWRRISAPASLARRLLLATIACSPNVVRPPLGYRQLAGNSAGMRGGTPSEDLIGLLIEPTTTGVTGAGCIAGPQAASTTMTIPHHVNRVHADQYVSFKSSYPPLFPLSPCPGC